MPPRLRDPLPSPLGPSPYTRGHHYVTGDWVWIDGPGGGRWVQIGGMDAPKARGDVSPTMLRKRTQIRLRGGIGEGNAICDLTPIEEGAKTKLGAF